ncbi:MAG: hypothetical protein ABL901_02420 [Hyphomicrobiaceae bacterium]
MTGGIDRVAMIRDSLLDSVFQIGWRRTGLFQMLNRALLAVQPSIVPVIFKKKRAPFSKMIRENIEASAIERIDIGGEFYYQVLNPFYDRCLGDRFAREIKKYTDTVVIGTKGAGPKRPRTLARRSKVFEFLNQNFFGHKSSLVLLRLFDTDYYVMLWDIDASANNVSLEAKPVEKDTAIGKIFARIFSPVDKPTSIKPMVARALRANARIIQYGTERFERDHELIAGTKEIAARIKNITALGERALREIIGGTYEKSSGSPLISGFDSCAPNMMVFWKIFDRRTTRCLKYTYDVRCIMPLRQQIDMVEALSRRRSWLLTKLPPLVEGSAEWEGVAKVDRRVRAIISTAPPMPALPAPFTQESIDAWFAAFADSPYRELIDAATGPQQCHERMFCEMTLSSGIYNQRKNPFEGDRLIGLQGGISCSPAEASRAHLRAVAFRYLMALMAPDDTDLINCSLIQIPIRVAGAPAACIVGLRRQTDVTQDVIEDDAFFYTHHYYHSISKHIIRDIRVKSRNVYGRLAGRLLEKHMMSQIALELTRDGPSDVDAMLAKVNFDLAALGRIFPYERISLVRRNDVGHDLRDASVPIEMGPRTNGSNVVPLFKAPLGGANVDVSRIGLATVECGPNSVFDRTGDEVFIRPEVVAREMSHGALNATSTPEFARLQQKWIRSTSRK